MRKNYVGLLATGLAAISFEAAAQMPEAQERSADGADPGSGATDEIVVEGVRRLQGVPGDIEPEFTIGEEEIGSYGASNLEEVLEAVAARSGSARGRGSGQPVLLLNGRRIAGFQELRNVPPEAIAKVEVYPEAVALQYGYTADQRVLNIVLKDNFRALTLEAGAGARGSGAAPEGEFEGSYLRLSPQGRVFGDFEIEQAGAIGALNRGIKADLSGPDDRALRTVAPRSEDYQATALWNHVFNRTFAGTASLSLGAGQTRSLIGADAGSGDAITSEGATRSAQLGLTLDASTSNWLATGIVTAAFNQSRTDTLPSSPALSSASEIDRTSLDAVVNASGVVFSMPAGAARLSLRANAGVEATSGESLRSGLLQETDLERTQLGARATLSAPLMSRREDGGFGAISASLTAALGDYSDFGMINAFGGSLNWSPTENLNLLAQADWSENAPSLSQLGDPVVTIPGALVYDPLTGDSVPVTLTSGGNPDLDAEIRTDLTLTANWSLKKLRGLTLSGSYVRNRTDDALASFPDITAATLAAYPSRFVRDAGGVLVAVDRAPVNFAERRTETLRFGAAFFRGFGPRVAGDGPAFRPGGGGPPGGAQA
ncbi:MAG: TonB-dependent receptor, partial [Parvularculaceae bacterium]|nr:TonB-dependent receptor [Parvularculaceae bacterium]